MNLKGKKVLLVKLRYIGDTMSIIPVIANLKQWAPHVIIDVMVNKGTEDVMAFHPAIHRIWAYDRVYAKKNIISSISYHNTLIKNIRFEKYDFVIDFTHGDRAAFLSYMTGAPIRVTYQKASTLSHLLMNRIIHSDPKMQHIVDYQLDSLKIFGMEGFHREMRVYFPDTCRQKVDVLLAAAGIGLNSIKVVIHPGARGKWRRWQQERFAEIGRRLREKYGAAVILLGGPGEEDILENVERSMGFPAAIKSTHLSLIEMAALLSVSQIFIGNDSAPGHIAAGVHCPNVTLFGPTFPRLWRPLSEVRKVVFKDVPCCGCRQQNCIRPENNCMDLIAVDEVWQKVEELLISH